MTCSFGKRRCERRLAVCRYRLFVVTQGAPPVEHGSLDGDAIERCPERAAGRRMRGIAWRFGRFRLGRRLRHRCIGGGWSGHRFVDHGPFLHVVRLDPVELESVRTPSREQAR